MNLTRQLPGLPDLRQLYRYKPEKYPHYLSSAADLSLDHPNERYSMLFLVRGETLELSADSRLHGPANLLGTATGFLQALEKWYQQLKKPIPPGEKSALPFCGGWFIYLGYEIAAEIEPVLTLKSARLPNSDKEFPIAFAQRCPAAIIIDHQKSKAWLVAEEQQLFAEMEKDIQASQAAGGRDPVHLPEFLLRADPDEEYLSAVATAIEYIHAGDVFQVNLSRAWNIRSKQIINPMTLLEYLQASNPAPFAGISSYKDQAIISSSPERLLEIRDSIAQTRPIAGTRPRSTDLEGDRALHAELINHPKERAEHIMLIDLERNDLGRVCKTGSVEVNELMVIEKHPHVHHIVSNIRGVLDSKYSPVDAVAALFPGGTITGCPKVRCMQIISELETGGRGVYTGSMGYLSRDGNLDMNILIRSLFQQNEKLVFRTGGGIVADSEPVAELAETVAKAKGILVALKLEEGITSNA